MRAISNIALTIGLVFSAMVCAALVAAQTCPECYYDRSRPSGNGAGVTPDGRTRLQIHVDTTGMSSSQQSAARSGVDESARMWNTTSSNNQVITYSLFQNDLNVNNSTFVVRIGTPGGAGCAEIDTTVLPHVITVSATLLGRPQADIAAAIAHEIGHRLGLAEARQGGTCGNSSSIMRGGTTACDMAQKQVTSNDVAQVYRSDFQQNTCTQSQPQIAVIETDSSGDIGGDPGGDPCAGNPCCYDPECCGDPYCGNQWCTMVCDYVCSRYCDEFDEWGHCTNYSGWDCEFGSCHQECY